MNKKSIVLSLLVLLLLTLACANPLASPAQPPANVETIVAATLSALTAVPADSSDILPHSLYYLANDAAGLLQVYRLEKDAKTIAQVTFEPTNITEYDVSPIDGSVVYISNNQLFTVNSDGSNRAMIFAGDAIDENNPFVSIVSSPVWSPDGLTIAFGHKGLNFYSIIDGQSTLVIENEVRDIGNGMYFPDELYWPELYSSDGSKLIITLGYYEGASTAIYYPANGSLTRLSGGEGSIICCSDYHLTKDASALFSASPQMGMFRAGLWRVDIASGITTTLLSADFDSNPAEVADNPFLAPDGQLYFFYASVPNPDGFINRAPLQLVRSAPDGITGRTVLRPETFPNLWQALWAPDASFVIVSLSDENFQGREAQLYYTDSQKAMIPLLPYAQDMTWGP
jgi:hypothetical protein